MKCARLALVLPFFLGMLSLVGCAAEALPEGGSTEYGIDEQASELLKHPEQKIEAVPVIENICKTISALEIDIKILRKASAKLILSNEASAISEYL